MRFAAYTSTSVALATGVVLSALHQRANFYSACVYIAQSNACLMILTNVALLAVSVTLLGLQKLLYGRLRPTEIEQLYEKAWFAITETCLAMTIFREEVGAWFLVMFVALLAGKVWAWIGEGRVEVLEQQPPSNPRLFHVRLSMSLVISTLFDIGMLSYSIQTVLHHARPNMMVMFAFEFAVLCVSSASTCGRYLITLRELFVIDAQTKERREQLRREREQQAQGLRRESSAGASSEGPPSSPLAPGEDPLDTQDIDVPGWEEKGRWIFSLELVTDFLKLVLYLAFFCVLCTFYGMPIHIIRDVALTIRSFHKRILDFIRYRQATRDMNTRYPDATPDDIKPEDCCIICREDMRPWPHATAQDGRQSGDNGSRTQDERFRPKKLPCGHVLHFACLRSWLERQQNCPTCRAPVLRQPTQPQLRIQNPPNNGLAGALQARPQQQPTHRPQDRQNGPRLQHGFQLGPLRVTFGAQNIGPNIPLQGGMPTQAADPNREHVGATNGPLNLVAASALQQMRTPNTPMAVTAASQLYQIEQQLLQELQQLQTSADELALVRALLNELARLRTSQAFQNVASNSAMHQRQLLRAQWPSQPLSPTPAYSSNQATPSMGSGHEHLPTNMTLPEGWTVLPLQPVSTATTHNLSGSTATNSQGNDGNVSNNVPSPRLSTASGGPAHTRRNHEAQQQEMSQSSGREQQGSHADEETALPQWGSSMPNATNEDSKGESANEKSEKQTRPGDEMGKQRGHSPEERTT